MKSLKIGILLLGVSFSGSLFAYGTGVSTYPIMLDRSLVSMEFVSVVSDGGGVGMQGRVTRKIRPNLAIEGGLGVSGGQRNSRIFAGADLEIFPEYGEQPKVSFRGQLENAREFGHSRNKMTIAPTVRRGIVLKGENVFVYGSLPYGVDLNSSRGTYSTSLSANFGLTGHIPFRGYRHIVGNVELSIDLKNSVSGVFAGLSWSVN